MNMQSGPRAFRFDDFEFSLQPLTLSRKGKPVPLQTQPLKLLALLVEKHGVLITHDEISQRLWTGRAANYSGSIHVYIRQLRAVLGDDASSPRFIETMPRQGYRFVSKVTHSPSAERPSARSSWTLTPRQISVCVVAVAALLGGVYWATNSNFTRAPADLVSLQAEDSFKRGLYLLEQRDEANNRKSLEYFEAALADSPNFAAAHIASARAFGRLKEYERARYHSQQALALNTASADAHAILGFISLFHDWTWKEASDHFQKALVIDSGNVNAHQGAATYYALKHDFESAIAHMRKARAIDPASTLVLSDLGWFYYFAGDFQNATSSCAAALDLAPNDNSHRHCLIRALSEMGDVSAVRKHVSAYMSASGGADAEIDNVLNQRTETLVAFDKWRLQLYEDGRSGGAVSFSQLAHAAAAAGEIESAIAYAERATNDREIMAPFLAVDPVFRPLANTARFQDLITQLGLDNADA